MMNRKKEEEDAGHLRGKELLVQAARRLSCLALLSASHELPYQALLSRGVRYAYELPSVPEAPVTYPSELERRWRASIAAVAPVIYAHRLGDPRVQSRRSPPVEVSAKLSIPGPHTGDVALIPSPQDN